MSAHTAIRALMEPMHELALCATQEATIVSDGRRWRLCRLARVPRGPQRRKLDRTMKVSIDTRYDTLEEALAVVALAFEASAKGATRKPKSAAKKATSGRKPGRQGAAPLAEPKAADTTTDAASPRETTGSRRRAGTRKTVARTATVANTATTNAPSRTRTASKSAGSNGSVKTKRVAAKKANPAQAQAPKPANVAPPGQSDKIRAWARSQGMQVADAGRMSAAVIAAYKAHHN